MSLKDAVRSTINRNAVTREWFVTFAARFSMRLFALQSFLSIRELRIKRRAVLWQKFVALLGRPNIDRVVIADGRATFYYRDGSAFYASTSRTSVSGSQFSHGDYEPHETRLMGELVQPGWTAVDAGANFGWHAIHLARRVGSTGRVFAFEPIPGTFKELAANVALNECPNLEACDAALGDVPGDVTFFVPEIDLGAGAASQFLDLGEQVRVRMLRLDDFLDERGVERVDFIKADIEGGELHLLEGAERLLTRCHPRILIEIVDVHCRRFGHTPADVVHYLTALGFTGRYVGDQGLLVAPDPGNLRNGNYLFEPA
jgi:FkbM family methyltransferase